MFLPVLAGEFDDSHPISTVPSLGRRLRPYERVLTEHVADGAAQGAGALAVDDAQLVDA
jgi:hypothetical protein